MNLVYDKQEGYGNSHQCDVGLYFHCIHLLLLLFIIIIIVSCCSEESPAVRSTRWV